MEKNICENSSQNRIFFLRNLCMLNIISELYLKKISPQMTGRPYGNVMNITIKIQNIGFVKIAFSDADLN